MRTLIAVTALIAGVLLVLVPRYILPTCEFSGFPHMHCSDTAHAEMITGGVFILIGIALFFLKPAGTTIAGGALCIGLAILSFMLPDVYGYCHSSRMPCNYGTVPAVRLVAVLTGLVMAVGLIRTVTAVAKKGNR